MRLQIRKVSHKPNQTDDRRRESSVSGILSDDMLCLIRNCRMMRKEELPVVFDLRKSNVQT